MVITLVSTDRLIESALQEHYQISSDISDKVFIDWLPPKQNLDQITILEDAIKAKSNILLFDRYLSLKQHEVDWLLKYKNVHLFEPCLITRKGFQYMPFWYKFVENWESDDEIGINIGVVDDIYRPNILYEYGIPKVSLLEGVGMTILFCSMSEYSRGYLPNMSDCFQSGCVPLLPGKHKYYWSLFPGLVVKNKKDVDWCVNVLRSYDALLYGIHNTIENNYPEMLVENVAIQIKQILK
jgi:hypothetical protein